MSLHPDPVEQLLERHGERWRSTFAPPPLDGMLAVATASPQHRTRWVWPLVAAVVLLVIPLATVLAVHGSHRSPAPAASQPTAPHPSDLLGDVGWSLPILQPDGRSVTVSVNVNATPHYCYITEPPIVRGVVSETATTVTITAVAYRPSDALPTPSLSPGTTIGCALIGHMPMPMTVSLKQPLGNRGLVDATTRTRQPLALVASTVPVPSYLPAGYVDRGFRWQDSYNHNPTQALHTYAGPGRELDLVRGRGPTTFSPLDRVLSTGVVLGHPAKLLQSVSYGTCLTWRDPEYWWSLCSAREAAPVAAGELLRIGNSIR